MIIVISIVVHSIISNIVQMITGMQDFIEGVVKGGQILFFILWTMQHTSAIFASIVKLPFGQRKA